MHRTHNSCHWMTEAQQVYDARRLAQNENTLCYRARRARTKYLLKQHMPSMLRFRIALHHPQQTEKERENAYKLHVCSQSGRHLLFFIILFFISTPASERKDECVCKRGRKIVLIVHNVQ